MRILVVDDDKFLYSDSMIRRLEHEGHDVVYCRYVREVKCGWFEVNVESLRQIRKGGVPDRVIQNLELILNKRFETEELFECEMERLLDPEEFDDYKSEFAEHVWQKPWDPQPHCILLDMMMPVKHLYSFRETDEGKETGIALLKDKDFLEKMHGIPVVVVTVNRKALLNDLVTRGVVRDVIYKPVIAGEVIEKIEQLFV